MPKLQIVFDRPIKNPNLEIAKGVKRDDEIYRAILGKKLYVSNLGGRLVDDKNLFELVSNIAVHKNPHALMVAKPPRTLSREQKLKVTDVKFPENFVVKEKANSGGVGVYLLAQMSENDVAKILQDVVERPDRYIVQEFVVPTLLPVANSNRIGVNEILGADRIENFENRFLDWGVFVFHQPGLKSESESSSGSILLRVANQGSSSTNTSQGAGYGIAYVYSETPKLTNLKTKPKIPLRQSGAVTGFFNALEETLILMRRDHNNFLDRRLKANLEKLELKHNEVFHFLGAKNNFLIKSLILQAASRRKEKCLETIGELILNFEENRYVAASNLGEYFEKVFRK
jgi:hypothetical protein